MAASAPATPVSTRDFKFSPVIDWARRSASAMRRAARSGSVAAGAPATRASGHGLKLSPVNDWAARSASSRMRGPRHFDGKALCVQLPGQGLLTRAERAVNLLAYLQSSGTMALTVPEAPLSMIVSEAA